MEILALTSPRTRQIWAIASAISALVAFGCDGQRTSAQDTTERPEPVAPPHHSLDDLQSLEVSDLRELDSSMLRRLRSSDAEIFPTCRNIFEEDGQILDWPLSSDEEGAALFGCSPETYYEFDDGRRAIAYATSMEGHDRATNLQIVYYDAEGTVNWARQMDRSREAQNFSASYRGSFLTAVDDRFLCAGTLWQGNTQAICIGQDDGEVIYDGRLDFWAGIEPFGFDGSLFSADLDGITRRYPFTGMEMRHRSFGERGGRAAFYATDEERIFFSPAEGDPIVSAWDLGELRRAWTTELPERPRVTYRHVIDEHQLLLLKVDDHLYGLDTATGQPRMAFLVGETHPPLAFSQDTLYLLLRRDDDPPLIYALNPTDGAVRWVAFAPTGTLRLAYAGGLLVQSVRAVRQVRPADEPGDD